MNAPTVITTAAGAVSVPYVLVRIIADKEKEVAERMAATSQSEIERAAAHAPPVRDFVGALCARIGEGRTGLIAEIKRASPSGGLIRDPFDPAALAKAYEAGGAACLSILTDGPYFQGAREHLEAGRAACSLPVLRKDFMIHPWQVFEARAMGADCILLIMACLSDTMAAELLELARSLDMAVLAEVHDRRELDRALGLSTRLIGINNRDLRTLQPDLDTTEALAPLVPADRLPVSESGIRTPADVRRMAMAGAHCILVGEHLMRQDDVTAAARALVDAR
jgi:indole-3-glycerol phosphate synthase